MTEQHMGFEPFVDWDGITDEMAQDLASTMADFRVASDAFAVYDGTSTGEPFRLAAANLMRAQHDLSIVGNAIKTTLWTVPTIIHVAGTRIQEEDSEGNDRVVQRCARCGSILQVWLEGMFQPTPNGTQDVSVDDIVWWGEGEAVAKAPAEGGNRMYPVRDRDLEEHESQCPNLAELGQT